AIARLCLLLFLFFVAFLRLLRFVILWLAILLLSALALSLLLLLLLFEQPRVDPFRRLALPLPIDENALRQLLAGIENDRIDRVIAGFVPELLVTAFTAPR